MFVPDENFFEFPFGASFAPDPIFSKFPEVLVLAHAAVVVGMAEGAILDLVELAGAGVKQLFMSTHSGKVVVETICRWLPGFVSPAAR